MIRKLLLLLVCALASIGAWAQTSVSLSDDGTTLTISTTEAGTLSSQNFDGLKAATTVVLVGQFNAADLQAIQTNGDDFKFTTVDMSRAVFVDAYNYSGRPEGPVTGYEWFSEVPTGAQNTNKIIVGGSLYQATTGTTKQWIPKQPHEITYNSSVYSELPNPEDFNAGNQIFVAQAPIQYVYCLRQQYNWGEPTTTEPTSYEIGNFKAGNKQDFFGSYTEGQWVRMYADSNNFLAYQLGETVSSVDWGDLLSGKTHETLSYVYTSKDNFPTSNVSNGQYAVEGGTEYVYDGSAWVDASTATSTVNWKAIKFKYWKGTITTAILPPNVVASDLDNPWEELSNERKLVKVQSGETYADISWGSPNAKITGKSEDECTRLKDILRINGFIDQNNIQEEIDDDDYIIWNETTQVYDVHVTSAGSLKRHFQALLSSEGANNLNGKVFHFEDACTGFTAEDLKALAPQNGPYLYLDLYDVTATPAVETAIEDALNGISDKGNGYEYKGLLLPKNPDRIGTALILNSGHSPVSDFIAYNNGSTTTAHIYNTSTASADAYAQKLTALKGIMDAHSAIASNTSVYLVSTNSKTPIANVESIKGTSTTASIVHTYNNEMVNPDATNPTKPCIEVIPAAAGDYATLNEATNMRNTPDTEVLKFKGAINVTDVAAINSFTKVHWDNNANAYVENDPKEYNGPRVLDLSEVTTEITKELLDNLSNPEIEYIILPAGMEAPVVGDYDDDKLPNLKCVISSNKSGDTEHVLNAYVKVAGSLAEARCLATGSASNTEFQPKGQGLTTIKLSGNLNANDVQVTGNVCGLKNELATITTLDLSDANFANILDMRLGGGEGGAGFSDSQVLTEVKLPTTMKDIPQRCLYGIKSLTNLHIPYNYETIGEDAFWETKIDHITTEDAAGALIDNGPKTWTLSANIKVLGIPNHGESTAVFPQTVGVTDVYCLATEVPVCYAHTFHADIVYGQGGMNDGIYCREKYQDGSKVIAVLHFPSQDSYTNATGDKEDSYNDLVTKYTDPTRAYSKKDQTGAVDANGNPLVWPDQGELLGSRTMAEQGYIWSDYENMQYQEGGDAHLISLGTPTSGPHNGEGEFYPNYVGWHEFVLSIATYVDPEEKKDEHDNIIRKYQEAGWYTFCIPFDMTVSQVREMLGVPASDPDNYIVCQLYDANGNLIKDDVTTPYMPEIRQLTAVTRKKGSGSANQVKFILTRDLYNNGSPLCLAFDQTQSEPADVITRPSAGVNSNNDPICLRGGHPYLIKAYKRYNPDNANEFKISGQNLGKYILTRYGDEFNKAASCVNYDDCMEQLGETAAQREMITLKFARPFEEHKVQAFRDDVNNPHYETYNDGTRAAKKYNYTMIGQFWQQELPQYCVYMSKGSWYRYTANKGYTWDPYKCIIMATPEIDEVTDDDVPAAPAVPETVLPYIVKTPEVLQTHHLGGKFRNFTVSQFPTVVDKTDDLLKADFMIKFKPGRDDDDFNQTASSKFTFAFEDGITEFDENGNEVTAIKNLDGEDIETMFATGKVYNMSGQYVGTSLDGLSKGMYIMNGKKYVVK